MFELSSCSRGLWEEVGVGFRKAELLPLRGLEGVPGLHGAPQDEAGLTRKFETNPVLVPHVERP